MARILLNLRLRLLLHRWSSLRRDPRRLQAAALTVAILGYVAIAHGGPVFRAVAASGELPDPEPILAQLSFSIVFLWIVLPLIYGGGRRDLDVRRFQLLPVRPIVLVGGLAATLILSPGVWVTGVVGVILAAGFPDAAAHVPLLALSVLALVLLCAVIGQVVVTGADLLGRRRHARDLLLLATSALAAVPVAMYFLLRAGYAEGGSGATTVFAWAPPAWPGLALAAAGQGRTTEALLALAGCAVVIGLGVWLWAAIVARAMLAQDSSTLRRGRSDDPFAAFGRRLPGNRRGAVAALELRLLLREPARLPGVVLGSVLFGVLFVVIAAALFGQRDPGMAVFGVIAVSIVAMNRRTNEIGNHDAELWTNVVARGRAADDLVGRDLASAVIDVPLLLVALIAVAVDRDGFAYAPAALVFGLAGLLAFSAGLRVVNVLMAHGQIRAKDAAATTATQDLPSNLATLLVWVVLVAPVMAIAAVPAALGAGWLVAAVPAAAVYGVGVWVLSLRQVGRWLDRHEAELLVRIQSA